jgi:hypothetical protein
MQQNTPGKKRPRVQSDAAAAVGARAATADVEAAPPQTHGRKRARLPKAPSSSGRSGSPNHADFDDCDYIHGYIGNHGRSDYSLPGSNSSNNSSSGSSSSSNSNSNSSSSSSSPYESRGCLDVGAGLLLNFIYGAAARAARGDGSARGGSGSPKSSHSGGGSGDRSGEDDSSGEDDGAAAEGALPRAACLSPLPRGLVVKAALAAGAAGNQDAERAPQWKPQPQPQHGLASERPSFLVG